MYKGRYCYFNNESVDAVKKFFKVRNSKGVVNYLTNKNSLMFRKKRNLSVGGKNLFQNI